MPRKLQIFLRKYRDPKLLYLIWTLEVFCLGNLTLNILFAFIINCILSDWQMRRIVVSKEFIGFARIGEDIMIDFIPLHEVELVRDMSSLHDEVDQTKFANALIISTSPDGHNSGRMYYLQAKSEELRNKLVFDLTKMASEARRRAEAKTRCAESQYLVRRVFQSNLFQLISALLIVAVSVLP
jgi:hypothetical protein